MDTAASFPRRYGADDVLGALNEVTQEKVRQAAALVRIGRRYALAQLLEDGAPTQMTRYWKHSLGLERVIPGRQVGENHLSFVEETVSGALHSGTHMDGLGHIGVGTLAYNGYPYADIVTSHGLTRLGIETVPPVMTRGVLLDIAALRGRAMLPDTYAITGQDLEEASTRQGVTVEAGDALLLHTGWGALWMRDNARYGATEPGLDLDGASWCTDRRVCLIGADNWAVEVVPAADPARAFVVHQHCLTRYGCYLIENVVTEELAAAKIWTFCFVVLPIRAKGGSGSPVAPAAMV